jgi:hypothetical protein
MNKALAIICFITALVVLVSTFPDSIAGVFILVVFSFATIVVIRKNTESSDFLVNIFVIALLVRVVFAVASHIFNFKDALGGDQFTYDDWGSKLVAIWLGNPTGEDMLTYRALNSASGWGMTYFTAAIYAVCGRNMLAAQFLCCVIGAATAPLIYVCAEEIYHNRRVSKYSAILVAFFPGFIVWSSQLLKDGLIIFLLVLIITMVLKLQKRFSYLMIAVLAASLFGILSLRFYIFFIVAVAVAGTFIIGSDGSIKTIVRGFVSIVLIGVVLTYVGAIQNAGSNLETYGSLERMQASRQDNARSAGSGFNEDVDISTPLGALQAFPLGLVYLMLAPFPWQMTNIRQLVTLPEMVIWWVSLPLVGIGLWFTIKNKLRNSVSILLFSLMLTIAYSITQGNIGTAYRQRSQIQVFMFIFIAVGVTLMLERRENKKVTSRRKRIPVNSFAAGRVGSPAIREIESK